MCIRDRSRCPPRWPTPCTTRSACGSRSYPSRPIACEPPWRPAPGERTDDARQRPRLSPVKLFAGVRVLDLSRMLAGPYGSMLLADLGAEVIKIEDPDGGDPMRMMGPPFLPDGESAYFLAINRNKKSIALDLSRERGRE